MKYIVNFGNCYLIASDKWVEVTQIRDNAKKFKSEEAARRYADRKIALTSRTWTYEIEIF